MQANSCNVSCTFEICSLRFSVFLCFLIFLIRIMSLMHALRRRLRGGGARCDQFQRLHQRLWEGPPVAACLRTFAADHSWAAEPNPDQLLSHGTALEQLWNSFGTALLQCIWIFEREYTTAMYGLRTFSPTNLEPSCRRCTRKLLPARNTFILKIVILQSLPFFPAPLNLAGRSACFFCCAWEYEASWRTVFRLRLQRGHYCLQPLRSVATRFAAVEKDGRGAGMYNTDVWSRKQTWFTDAVNTKSVSYGFFILWLLVLQILQYIVIPTSYPNTEWWQSLYVLVHSLWRESSHPARGLFQLLAASCSFLQCSFLQLLAVIVQPVRPTYCQARWRLVLS